MRSNSGQESHGLVKLKGLVQVVDDNFDADICSVYGKVSIHTLAIMVTQQEKHTERKQNRPKIKRVSKDMMSEPIDYEVDIQKVTVR